VQVGRRSFPSQANVIGIDHVDFVRLWTFVNTNTRGRYDRYQQQTKRRFDFVKLHPDK